MDGLSDTPSTLTSVPRTDGGKLFDAMATSFAERLRELKGLMMLRTADEPEEALTSKLAKIDASLTSVEQAFVALRGAVAAEKQCIPHAREFAHRVCAQGLLLQQARPGPLGFQRWWWQWS
jgi:hypothetical protein